MGKALEEDIDGAINNSESKMDNLIQALDSVLSTEQLDQKSDLTANNVIGMIRMLNYATELFILYRVDIRLTVMNMVTEKLSKVISLDRKGRGEIIEIVRAIRAELQTETIADVGQRFIYGAK